eukprot:31463-Pelagococcus_subviridis.AAC.4
MRATTAPSQSFSERFMVLTLLPTCVMSFSFTRRIVICVALEGRGSGSGRRRDRDRDREEGAGRRGKEDARANERTIGSTRRSIGRFPAGSSTHVSVEADLHEPRLQVTVRDHQQERAVRLVQRTGVVRDVIAQRAELGVLKVRRSVRHDRRRTVDDRRPSRSWIRGEERASVRASAGSIRRGRRAWGRARVE